MKFSKATKLSAIIMTFVLVLGLVACSADKTEKKKAMSILNFNGTRAE